MRPSRVELVIGELELQGLPAVDRDRLVRAMERELSELMREWTPAAQGNAIFSDVQASPVTVRANGSEAVMGRDIARSVFHGIATTVNRDGKKEAKG